MGNSYYSNTFKISSLFLNYTLNAHKEQKIILMLLNLVIQIFSIIIKILVIFFLLFFIFLSFNQKKNVVIYVNITNNISAIENFNVEVFGILTDSISVMKAKRNLTTEFKIGGNSECKFDNNENSAVFKFKAKDIKEFKVDEQKYFYIKLNARMMCIINLIYLS